MSKTVTTIASNVFVTEDGDISVNLDSPCSVCGDEYVSTDEISLYDGEKLRCTCGRIEVFCNLRFDVSVNDEIREFPKNFYNKP